MATYKTQIQWGGPDAEWHDDHDLTIQISNRENVVPTSGSASNGTSVNWSGPSGSGNIMFFNDSNSFQGSAQFPGEGPVGYRGQLKS